MKNLLALFVIVGLSACASAPADRHIGLTDDRSEQTGAPQNQRNIELERAQHEQQMQYYQKQSENMRATQERTTKALQTPITNNAQPGLMKQTDYACVQQCTSSGIPHYRCVNKCTY